MTKTVRVKCRRCGHEFRAEILTREEENDPRRPRSSLRCEKCGSTDVEIR